MAQYLPIEVSVPLNDIDEHENYTLHFYEGFKGINLARKICDKFLDNLVVKYGLEHVHIYLYLIDFDHNFCGDLVKANCNNGYTVRFSEQRYSIVIFRHKFWPKVLLHEIFHVLWFCGGLDPITAVPKYDESIVEFYAVHYAITNNYINEAEYTYYLGNARRDLVLNTQNRFKLCGGSTQEVVEHLLSFQQTPVAEYIYGIANVYKENKDNPAYKHMSIVDV